MIPGIAFLLIFFVATPAYFALHSSRRLPWGGERELFGITLALSVALGAWVLGWDGIQMLERSELPQLEVLQRVRENPAICATLWRQSPLLLVQALPLCAGGSALYLPGAITAISWLVFLAAAWIAGCAVAGPLAGVGALLLLLALPLMREPFLALGPEPLWLAGAAVTLSALMIARSWPQWVVCAGLVASGAAVALTTLPPAGGRAAASDIHTGLVPLVVGALLGGYLLRFFTGNLRRSYVEVVALRRLVLAGTAVAVLSLVTVRDNGLSTLLFGILVFIAAVGCGAVVGGLGRFLGVHPVAAPVALVCAALLTVFVSLPQHRVSSGVVSLASDLAAIAPAEAVIGSAISPGVLRDFVSTREIVSYAELARRAGQGAATVPFFVETRFASSEQVQELRSRLHIEPVLPGIYRVLPLTATTAH